MYRMQNQRRPFPGLWPLATLAALAAACQDAPTPPPRPDGPPNVVLVCLDTVRADHLGVYGHPRDTTPFLDDLARNGTWFQDASATAGWTKPSVPSFLTGTFPCQHGVYEGSARLRTGTVTDIVPDEALTLAEVFQDKGYRTAAFVHNAQLRYGNGFEQGFDLYAQENWDAREIRWRGIDWIDEEAGRPFFLYLHFLDAHWPYPAPHSYATRYASADEVEPFRGKDSKALRDALNDGALAMTDEHRKALEALYDGSIRYLDDNLAAFHRALVLRGLAENTILCVVADHGEEFGEHGRIGHGHGLWKNLLQVPWILYVPGRPSQVVRRPVSLIDLFPTLLSAAGIQPPSDLPGVDRLSQPDASRPIFAEHKSTGFYMQALRGDRRKLVRTFFGPERLVGGNAPFHVGERWEIEIERRADGTWIATEMKPDDDDPSDPVEIKGHVQAPGPDRFSLGEIAVRFDSSTHRQITAEARDDTLTEGRLVKVKGRFQDGIFHAERIKFYAPYESNPLEIRGEVLAVEEDSGSGRVRVGDLWIAFDETTDVKGGDSGPKRKRILERSDIVRILEDPESAVTQLGLEEHFTTFDIQMDPEEQEGSEQAPADLVRVLDNLGQRLVRTRVFEGADRLLLTPEAVQDLRDIGYAE